jgi:hypothetical protein
MIKRQKNIFFLVFKNFKRRVLKRSRNINSITDIILKGYILKRYKNFLDLNLSEIYIDKIYIVLGIRYLKEVRR